MVTLILRLGEMQCKPSAEVGMPSVFPEVLSWANLVKAGWENGTAPNQTCCKQGDAIVLSMLVKIGTLQDAGLQKLSRARETCL